jgi:TonB family protein
MKLRLSLFLVIPLVVSGASAGWTQQKAAAPLPKSSPTDGLDPHLAKLLGAYFSDRDPRGSVMIGSLGRGVVSVKRGTEWDGVGYWDGREFRGVVRSPYWGAEAKKGLTLGTLRFFQAASGETLLAEVEMGGKVARETWTRGRVVVDPGRSSNSSPAFGEYVYVEELPEVVNRVAPVFPQEARERRVDGTVQVQALVGEDGRVKEVRVTKSIPELDAAALAAVRQWIFKPALSKGKPVAVWVAVPVRFSLN